MHIIILRRSCAGGKLLYDGHASRVLPGFDPTCKSKIILDLAKSLNGIDVIFCISAPDVEHGRVWVAEETYEEVWKTSVSCTIPVGRARMGSASAGITLRHTCFQMPQGTRMSRESRQARCTQPAC